MNELRSGFPFSGRTSAIISLEYWNVFPKNLVFEKLAHSIDVRLKSTGSVRLRESSETRLHSKFLFRLYEPDYLHK